MTKVLIISGWIGSKKIFSPIINQFEKDDIRFIDFKEISSKENILEIARENIEDFNPDIIIAWSMGALAVLKVLENLECKSKLVLVSPTSKFTKSDYNSFGWNSRIIDSMIKSLKINKTLTIEKFCKNMLCKNEVEYESEIICSLEVLENSLDSNRLSNGLLFLRDVEAINIDKIVNETLIIHGKEDFICSVHGGEYITNKLKNSTLKIIENCGHIPFITKEKEFTNILYDFLGDNNDDR